MNSRVALHAGVVLLAVTTASCGDNVIVGPPQPAGPSSLTPLFVPQVAGVWGGPVTLTSIAGGTGPARTAGSLECVGAAFNAIIGESNDHTLTITQTGTDVSARLASAGTGLACTYAGRVSNGTLALDAATCTEQALILRCQPDAEGNVLVRRMELVGSSITASLDAPVRVTSVSGTAAHTYNLTGPEGNPVGSLVAHHTFGSLTRR